MNNKIKCNVIAVDTEKNDPVDIRCGGPTYLGYDYFVKSEETESLKSFIKKTFASMHKEYIRIYVSAENIYKPANKVWDKSRIYKDLTGKNYSEKIENKNE